MPAGIPDPSCSDESVRDGDPSGAAFATVQRPGTSVDSPHTPTRHSLKKYQAEIAFLPTRSLYGHLVAGYIRHIRIYKPPS